MNSKYHPYNTGCRMEYAFAILMFFCIATINPMDGDNSPRVVMVQAANARQPAVDSLEIAILREDIVSIDRIIKSDKALLEIHDFQYGNTPLMFAADNGKINAIKKLLDLDADINARDQYKNTLMHCAIWSNNLEVLQFIWTLPKVKRNVKNKSGQPPIVLAAQFRKFEAVKFLLARAANVGQVFKEIKLRDLLEDAATDFDLIRLLVIRGAFGHQTCSSLMKSKNATIIAEKWKKWQRQKKLKRRTAFMKVFSKWQREYLASRGPDKNVGQRLPLSCSFLPTDLLKLIGSFLGAVFEKAANPFIVAAVAVMYAENSKK